MSRKDAILKAETDRAHSAPEVRGSVAFVVDFPEEHRSTSAKKMPARLTTEKKSSKCNLV